MAGVVKHLTEKISEAGGIAQITDFQGDTLGGRESNDRVAEEKRTVKARNVSFQKEKQADKVP